jgi:hypothetical protein
MTAPQGESKRRPVAAVITEWRALSHADVILSRLLEPEAWGHRHPLGLELVAVYADQFPKNDLCRSLCGRHGVPIFPTITEAVGVGTRGVPVEGVLIIGEHGQYAANAREQRLYPRRRLFEGVVHAFRVLGRRVPVFTDKHLSYEWLSARWMYDLARHEGIPLMAGSSLPVAWREPEVSIPIGSELSGAFALGYADLDAYGFHALETLQCMVERRKGGETGVASVRCLSGKNVWEGLDTGLWSRDLLDALTPARRVALPSSREVKPLPSDTLFLVNYCDGLKAIVGMFDSVGECFAFAGRRRDVESPVACVFDLENQRPFGHFGHLVRAVEQMIVTGKPSYPVERTLLTTGVLSALLQSRVEGGTTIRTPHLSAIRYTPADWPYAPGRRGTPA